VDSIRNQASGQLVSGKQPVDDIVMAMHFAWATVAKMGAEGRAGAYRNIDLPFARVCVPKGNAHARLCGGRDKVVGAAALWRESHEPYLPIRSVLLAAEFRPVRVFHQLSGMSALITGFSAEVWALQMIAYDGFENALILRPETLKRLELAEQRLWDIRDKRRKNPFHIRLVELLARVPNGGETRRTLKVDARESVDLKVEKAAHIPLFSGKNFGKETLHCIP